MTWAMYVLVWICIALPQFSYSASVCYSDPKAAYHALKSANKAKQQTRIDLNSADVVTLAHLEGIGMKKAQAIVQYRQTHGRFVSTHDLTKVPGIGQATFEKNKDRISVL